MTEQTNPNIQYRSFFWEFLSVIFKWRRLLIFNAMAAAVLTLAIMLLLPNRYKATTSLLPPEKDTGMSLVSSMLPSGLGSLLGGGGLALPGLATPSDLYAAVARSRSVLQAVINKNDLRKVYKVKDDEKAIKELLKRTSVSVSPEGIISIEYEDTKPERAAVIANGIVEELNRVNRENMNSKARSLREFVDKRLSESVSDLALAEESYKNFQQEHHAVSLDDQVKAAITAMADLRGQLVISEIELGVMQKSMLPSNPRYQEQEYKVEQIKNQLQKLERGDTLSTGASILSVPMGETPELGLELARLTRDLKIQETIFEMLKQQYEQAKIQEMKDTPSVQVLDRAEIPLTKSGPKRTIFAAMGGLMSFGLSLILVMVLEYVRRERDRNSAAYQKIQSVSHMFNEDYYWLRNMFSSKGKKNVS